MRQSKLFINVLLLVLFIAFFSCHRNSNEIEIKGDIKGLNATWIYLYNTYPVGSKPIDSARVINDSFTFHFHPDTIYETHLVFIICKNKTNKIQPLGIINPSESKDGKEHLYGDFLMETGTSELTGDLTKGRGIQLKSGPQNEFRFENIDLPFIQISHSPTKHKSQVEHIIKSVKDMPDAYYAMFALSNLQYQLDNDELKQIYNAFDDKTKRSYSGKKVKEFLDFRSGTNDLMPNNSLVTDDGKQTELIDTTKKLNMIIFWASWCGPCRQEIPVLKTIASEVSDNRFRMVSVSVDRDKSKWKKALKEEKMPWQQLNIDSTLINRVQAQYNLNAIPQIYLIDNKGKLIKHMTGFEPAHEAIFKKDITDFLKK
jgi:thiol-disulfide isomerase/thioredoxin